MSDMEACTGIESFIRAEKFTKFSPDGLYRIQTKNQSAHSREDKEQKNDLIILPEMTCKPAKTRDSRKSTRLPSEDSSSGESIVMGIPSRRDTGASRGRVRNARGKQGRNKVEISETKAIGGVNGKKVKRAPRATETTAGSSPIINSPVTIPTQEQINPEEKFQRILSENLRDYSRQRMRALHMSLRHFSNVEARITQKELAQAFQDNQMKLSGRVNQYLIDRFEDNRGIDCEYLYRFLTEAHLQSGRDSVIALQRRNDLETQTEVTSEERDADLILRLEQLLIDNQGYINIEALRENFQFTDNDKSGKIDRNEVVDICSRHHTPLYGALFKSLLRRCDEEGDNTVSWPEFLNFLDLSQQNAQKKNPSLLEIPIKIRSRTPVAPSAIDELSEETKSRLVSKLRKKASLVKDRRALSLKQSGEAQNPIERNGVTPHKEEREEKPATEEDEDRKRLVASKRKSEPDMKATVLESEDTDNDFENQRTSSPPPVMSESANMSSEQSACPTTQSECSQSAPLLATSEVPVPIEDSQNTAPENVTGSTHAQNKHGHLIFSITTKGRRVDFQLPCDVSHDYLVLDPPTQRLKLDWVYGYRGNDCRSNIYVLATDEIVYFVSNIAVLYNRQTHKQRHYREHSEDIKCLAAHFNRNIVVTGQRTSNAYPQNQACIRIWRADTLQTTHVLGAGLFQKSVLAVAFSGSSDLLAAVDDSPEKRLTLWDVSSGELKGDTIVNTEVICDLQFNTKYPELLVISGKEHLSWWKIYPDSRMFQPFAQPDYENYLRAKYVICVSHSERGDLLTGDSNGTVYVWGDGGNKITNFIKHAHDGPVFTVLCMKSYILTGGRDGFIYCWQFNKNMDKDGTLQLPKSEGGVRLLSLHNEAILIGTTVNSMLSITSSKKHSPLKGAQLDQLPITQGHFSEVRGLAIVSGSASLGSIVTAGTDGILCWYNPHGRDPVCKLVLKGVQFLCVDALPSGTRLALGTRTGHLVILDIEGMSSTEAFDQKLCKDKITAVKFSPDGASVAAGSTDCGIYICTLTDKEDGLKCWEFTAKFKEHTGPIQSLDWSMEPWNSSFLIKSCTSVPEQFVWNITNFCLVDKLDTRSVKWRTETCPVDVSMCGLWGSKQARNSEVHCMATHPNNHLVAIGDSSGHISLFRYPNFKQGAFCHTYKGHSCVRNVVFSQDGQFVFSVGGRDSAILQWEVT